jgi:hypothetical protein
MFVDVLVLICLLLVMFLPYFIVRSRKHKNQTVVFWINLILGWTVIFWLPLLVYSLVSDAD